MFLERIANGRGRVPFAMGRGAKFQGRDVFAVIIGKIIKERDSLS